jgi:hypothetical protein
VAADYFYVLNKQRHSPEFLHDYCHLSFYTSDSGYVSVLFLKMSSFFCQTLVISGCR